MPEPRPSKHIPRVKIVAPSNPYYGEEAILMSPAQPDNRSTAERWHVCVEVDNLATTLVATSLWPINAAAKTRMRDFLKQRNNSVSL